MPQHMPEIEIDDTGTAPHEFRSVRHARRVDLVRGIEIELGAGRSGTTAFLTYIEAAKLHEALSASLAFLDADE